MQNYPKSGKTKIWWPLFCTISNCVIIPANMRKIVLLYGFIWLMNWCPQGPQLPHCGGPFPTQGGSLCNQNGLTKQWTFCNTTSWIVPQKLIWQTTKWCLWASYTSLLQISVCLYFISPPVVSTVYNVSLYVCLSCLFLTINHKYQGWVRVPVFAFPRKYATSVYDLCNSRLISVYLSMLFVCRIMKCASPPLLRWRTSCTTCPSGGG